MGGHAHPGIWSDRGLESLKKSQLPHIIQLLFFNHCNFVNSLVKRRDLVRFLIKSDKQVVEGVIFDNVNVNQCQRKLVSPFLVVDGHCLVLVELLHTCGRGSEQLIFSRH